MYQPMRDARVKDVIRNKPKPVVKGARSVMNAIDEMEALGVGAVGVECEGRFVGIFTRSDFMKKVICHNLNPRVTSLFEVMTFNPVVISPWDTVHHAQKQMAQYRVRHLPVLEGGIFRGILNEEDISLSLLKNYEHISDEYNSILAYIHGESYGRCAY